MTSLKFPRPLPGYGPDDPFQIVDTATGEVCGPLKAGEFWIKGPQVMKGYLNNEKATKEMVTPDGWLKTGQLISAVAWKGGGEL